MVSRVMNSEVSMVDRIPERSSSTAWQIVEGELILLRLKADELLGLNHVARRIWELSDGTRTVAQIARVLASEFDVSTESVLTDSCHFINELAAMGAVILRPVG